MLPRKACSISTARRASFVVSFSGLPVFDYASRLGKQLVENHLGIGYFDTLVLWSTCRISALPRAPLPFLWGGIFSAFIMLAGIRKTVRRGLRISAFLRYALFIRAVIISGRAHWAFTFSDDRMNARRRERLLVNGIERPQGTSSRPIEDG
jgi:hypothetical protein